MNLELQAQEVENSILSEMPNVYLRPSVFVSAIIRAVSMAIQISARQAELFWRYISLNYATGQTVVGYSGASNVPGVSISYMDQSDYPDTIDIRCADGILSVSGYPDVSILDKRAEYELVRNGASVFVVVDPSKLIMPVSGTISISKIISPDYLNEIAKNRGIERMQNESDDAFRARAIAAIHEKCTDKNVRMCLTRTLGEVQITERPEICDIGMTIGMSFLGYTGEGAVRPGALPERYCGAYYAGVSSRKNVARVSIPRGNNISDDTLNRIMRDVRPVGVRLEYERVL